MARAALEAFKAANAEGLRLRAQQEQSRQAEERKQSKDFMKAMEERELRREREQEALQERQRRLFERGGGKALQAGLEEQVRRLHLGVLQVVGPLCGGVWAE
jgi:Flp pilus assembly protein TadB